MASHRRGFLALITTALLAGAGPSIAQDKPIKIALIASKTGPLETYGRDTERGLRLGLEYMTQGTMKVLGRRIEVIVKDDQMKPELSKALLTEAYADDHADIAVGTSWSGGSLAMAPVAQEYKRLLFIDPAIADSLTGKDWNRYIFRAIRNTTQDAMAALTALKDGDNLAFLAVDDLYGRDGVSALKDSLIHTTSKVKIAQEEYVPVATTDFTAPMQRIFSAMDKQKSGRKYLVVIWRSPNPLRKLADLNPSRHGIEFMSIGGGNLETVKQWKGIELNGGIFYFYTFPKNAMNDWLVKEHMKRYQMPPDMMTACGFMTAAAIVTGLNKAQSVDTEKLIAAMEGMEFDSPKGKAVFRRDDHQAMQTQYVFKMKGSGSGDWDLLDLVKEVPASDMQVPVTTRP